MAERKQKLELTWIGKENRPRLEPRILLEDPDQSYHAPRRVSDKDIFDNHLIFGDNLLALKALEQEFAGKIKCVFIDPPYNTGSAFKHYDDGLEHSLWLSLMRDRIEILGRLLSEDGSLWITIDDNEGHYLKVMCDEILGRSNFLCDIAWEKRYSPPPDTKEFGYIHDHILCYRKSTSFRRNLLSLTEDQTGRYKNPDNDLRGQWKAMDYTCRYTADERPNLYYPIIQPNTGEEIWPKKTRVWAMSREVHERNAAENRIWWGSRGRNSVPALKNFLTEINQGMMPMSLWKHTMVGHTQDAKKEMLSLFGEDFFSTPKPEKLLSVILHIATNPGDLVLDSFAGSGTTGAVAHKMGRRWIMVELGEHCHTHIIPRIKKVIDGSDQGGISKAVNWQGGGGFRYYRLAPSLLEKDKWDNWVISKEYNAAMLAAAMAKHEGFVYNPDETLYWKQGRSTEKDYIFTTTNFITVEYLDGIHEEMAPGESLLLCCKSYQEACADRYPNITVKKIPNMLLGRCEFGRDDYSLNIANMPIDPDRLEIVEVESEPVKKSSRRKVSKNQSILFDEGGEAANTGDRDENPEI
ncbi:site-specific DNA-methyltransferase [Patescibacteria group bacterium]|nr:site-specific DNA-methyltransferase [Patescibacteria group bacterium]